MTPSKIAIGLALVLVLLLLCAPATSARTWHIEPDGTGDAPTIQAGVDSSTAGDVVELADGTFTGDGNRAVRFLGKPIRIRSQSGDPEACVVDCEGTGRGFAFYGNEGPASILEGVGITGASYAAIDCYASPTITGCLISANSWSASSGSAVVLWNSGATLSDCTIVGNSGTNPIGAGGGVLLLGSSSVGLSNCTIADNTSNGLVVSFRASVQVDGSAIAFNSPDLGVACLGSSSAILSCCDVFGNAGGDWVGCLAGLLGALGNVAADPLFCDRGTGDYRVMSASPCAPDNSGGCGLIGAQPVGCGAVTVEPSSWGGIKGMYR